MPIPAVQPSSRLPPIFPACCATARRARSVGKKLRTALFGRMAAQSLTKAFLPSAVARGRSSTFLLPGIPKIQANDNIAVKFEGVWPKERKTLSAGHTDTKELQ